MLDNTAIKIASSKLASASAPFIPGTLILLSGIVVWRLWQNQSQLQTQTTQLNNELRDVKKQVAEIKGASDEKEKSETPLASASASASALKDKALDFLPKSASKWLSKK